ITPINDNLYQPTKTIILDLQVNPNYTFSFGFLSSAKINVVEDDPVPETTVPTGTIAQPKAKSFNSPFSVDASGSAASGSNANNDEVTRVTYRLNNGPWKLATFNPGPSGDWTATLAVPDVVPGANRLDVQSTDTADNLSKIASKEFD